MACRLGMRGPRLLPGGPTLQPGTPSWPPLRAEPGSLRIAAAGFVCSAESLSPRPGAGSTLGEREGERRGSAPGRGRGERESRSDPGGTAPRPLVPPHYHKKEGPETGRDREGARLGRGTPSISLFSTVAFLYTKSSPRARPWEKLGT